MDLQLFLNVTMVASRLKRTTQKRRRMKNSCAFDNSIRKNYKLKYNNSMPCSSESESRKTSWGGHGDGTAMKEIQPNNKRSSQFMWIIWFSFNHREGKAFFLLLKPEAQRGSGARNEIIYESKEREWVEAEGLAAWLALYFFKRVREKKSETKIIINGI